MTTHDNAPPPPDWAVCEHTCPVFDLAEYARRRIVNAAGDHIPDNIQLSEN